MSAIDVENVGFSYPGTQEQVLHDISFQVPDGEWLAVIGRNGSGKSTLVQLLAGLHLPSSGSITIGDTPVNDQQLSTIHQRVGIVFQNPSNQFVGSTVAEDVAFGLENHQVPSQNMPAIIERALKAVHMWDYRNAAPDSLSGGQQQRVAIAGVLALHPQVLIFDESTSMLDPLARQQIIGLLHTFKGQGLTIIMVTHQLSEAEEADRVLAIERGTIIANGPIHNVLSQGTLIQRLGLHLAPGQALLNELRDRGITIPGHYLTTEEAVQWLKQRLNLTQ